MSHFLHIFWSLRFIFLALIATVALEILLNIITQIIDGGSTSSRSADPAIGKGIANTQTVLAIGKRECRWRIDKCECRCHKEGMMPGMRCIDCYGLECDEGTQMTGGYDTLC